MNLVFQLLSTDLNFEIRKFNPPFEIIEDFQMDTLMNKNKKGL